MDPAAKKLLEEIARKKPRPVYFLQGDEPYFIDLISNAIEQTLLSDAEKSFNQVVLYGGESNVQAILSNARRFPMMAEYQVVIVREAQELQDLYKEQSSRLLIDYLQRPVPSTVLVLCHKHKALDKRRELGKKAEQAGVVTTFKKVPDYKLPEFVSGYFKEKGYQVSDGAAQVFSEYVGNDLNRVAGEADKVMISRPSGFRFEAEHIMAEVGISREFNIFELQKAVVTRNARKVYAIVRYFQANPKRNPAIPAVAFLYAFFSRLLAAASLSDSSPGTLAAQLKMSPMMANDYATALNHYPLQRIRENVSLLKEADLRLKGFGAPGDEEGQVLQELVFRLIM
ncbi:MAG: DNA polymerase III subunit delta [Bacteroidota bacterium]